jgi:hypothetical protein
MADRKLERRIILDPAVAGLLTDMEHRQSDAALPRREREKKARETAKMRARRDQRATFDLPPTLRQQLMEKAEAERLPASQLVTLALVRLFQDLSAGSLDLVPFKQPSRSPRYDWNLVLPETLLPAEPKKSARKSVKIKREA